MDDWLLARVNVLACAAPLDALSEEIRLLSIFGYAIFYPLQVIAL